jgi:uncharacterized protein (DUF697 family)
MTCKDKAKQYVHLTAAGGAVLAPVPIPFMGTVGLIGLETTLVYWVGRIYGETLTKTELATIVTSLEVGSLALKLGVLEALNFVPIAGWLLKAPVAAGVIEGIGNLAVSHFEDKYPGKSYVADPDVEKDLKNKKQKT